MDRLNEESGRILQQRLSNLREIEDGLRHKQEELQRQLERIRKEMDATGRAVVAIQCDIKERENMLLPVVAFPTEILRLIFLRVVGFVPGYLEEPPYPMSLTLSSVCRRWRSILLGDPTLWTHITIAHSHFYNLEPYLTRSAGLPLEISFFGPWDISPLDARSRALLCTLGKEAHRWQRLQMDTTCVSDGFLPFLSQKRAASFNYIHLTNDDDLRSPVPVFPAFSVHQNDLHTLILVRVPMFKALVAPRLRHFTFISWWEDTPELWVSPDRLWRVLSSTTNLQTLHLGVESVVFDGPIKTILLPHLQRFTVMVQSEIPDLVQLSNLLDMISAPALQVIEFTAEDWLTNRVQSVMWKLALCRKPRYPTVTHVILYNVLDNASDIGSFIKAFPDITILTLDHRGVTLCNAFLKKHAWSYECWEKLKTTRVRSGTHGPNFDQARWKDLYIWLRRREKLGLAPSGLELVIPAIQDGSVPFYLDWESVIRFEVRIERMDEKQLRVHESRIW